VKAEAQAQAEGHKAKQLAAEARAVLTFFQDKVLAAARPQGQEGGLGREATIRAAVDAAEPGIGAAFANQPAVEAAVRHTLGMTYLYLGETALAIRQHERALALRRQVLGPDHLDTLDSLGNLANSYMEAGRLEGVALLEETLRRSKVQRPPDHPNTLSWMASLAMAYLNVGRPAEAVVLQEEVLRRLKTKLGPDAPETLRAMNDLGITYLENGRLAEAIALHEETVRRQRAKLGPDHPDMLFWMNNLARAYRFAGRFAEGVALQTEVVKLHRAKFGPDHPQTLQAMQNLGHLYADAGRLDQALPLLKEALKQMQVKSGRDHPVTLSIQESLGRTYDRRPGAAGAVLRGDRQAGRGGQVAEGTGSGEGEREAAGPAVTKVYLALSKKRCDRPATDQIRGRAVAEVSIHIPNHATVHGSTGSGGPSSGRSSGSLGGSMIGVSNRSR
jgi:tetratricopeptide (TPR) repeat protein